MLLLPIHVTPPVRVTKLYVWATIFQFLEAHMARLVSNKQKLEYMLNW